MSAFAWVAIVIAVAATVAAVERIASAAGKRSEAQLSAARQEMQRSIADQSLAVNAHINQQVGLLTQTVMQQLGQVRQDLQSGVASSGKLASDAQREVAQRLQSSNEALAQINQRIGELYQTSQDMSKASTALQSVLGGAKTRGVLGEVTLERLLADALPQSAYFTQFRFASTGAIVDAAVRHGERLLCVDSKFPLESYRRLVESGEDARREFSQAVRKHADSIAEKYILPGEHTFDYALMFVPSEGVYYELLMTEDAKYGQLDGYCRGKRVFPVSPNTLYAYLSAVSVSLQSQKLAENAQHLLASVAGIRKQFDVFGSTYEKLGTHLRHAQQSYEDADGKLGRVRNSLEQMSQGALPDATVLPAAAEPTVTAADEKPLAFNTSLDDRAN